MKLSKVNFVKGEIIDLNSIPLLLKIKTANFLEQLKLLDSNPPIIQMLKILFKM